MSKLQRDLRVSVIFTLLAVVSVFGGLFLGWLIPNVGIVNVWRSVSLPLLIVSFILHLNVSRSGLSENQQRVYRVFKHLIIGAFVTVLLLMTVVFGFFLTWLD